MISSEGMSTFLETVLVSCFVAGGDTVLFKMSGSGAIVIGLAIVAFIFFFPDVKEKNDKKEQEREERRRHQDNQYYQASYSARRRSEPTHKTAISYSNPHNNHDHQKRKHETRASAEREVDRMRWKGLPDSERMNVYYNDELDGWFVGRSRW